MKLNTYNLRPTTLGEILNDLLEARQAEIRNMQATPALQKGELYTQWQDAIALLENDIENLWAELVDNCGISAGLEILLDTTGK